MLKELGILALAVAVSGPAAAQPRPEQAPLSLAACLREALAANPELRAAAARAAASEAAAAAAAAGRVPRFDLTAGYLYSDRAQRLVQPAFPGEVIRYDHDIAEASLAASMPLWAGGGLTARIRAEGFAAAAARATVKTTRQDLALGVAATYLAAVGQRAAIAAVEASLAALDGQLAVARALEDVGRIAPLDRLKVEVRAAEVRQTLSRARRDRDLVRHHLASLLGRSRDRAIPEVEDTFPPIPLAADHESLLSQALAARPEVEAARHAVERARARLAAAGAERWPEVDAYARYTARSVVPSAGGGLPAGRVGVASGGVNLRLPLWVGGGVAARVAQAQAQVVEAEESLRAVELRVTEEVRRELAAFAEAGERQEVTSGALQHARDAFAIEQANYELGRSTINDVLDAQAAMIQAELAVIQANHDRALAAVAVARATGHDIATLVGVGKEDRR